ncbi:MAG: UvrD-helicase domain-containing protein, partial [Lachnospiraceae bacterium]|nr:UvrD-helicase domain-containing protein [Lachnospiraceae bacterium]
MGEDINPGQRLAIDHHEGPMMVIAGPGSGKTFVITRRIKKLIESGIPPEEILVITFTKAAALGMQSRFRELMSDEASSVTFG